MKTCTAMLALTVGMSACASSALAQHSYRRVAGPVAVDSRRSTYTPIANHLHAGRWYLVAVSGRFSYWSSGGLCDGCFIIQQPSGGGMRVFPTLRFNNPAKSLSDLITEQTKKPPVYNNQSGYYAWIWGTGRGLSAMIYDQPGMHVDNRGSLHVTVYELVQHR